MTLESGSGKLAQRLPGGVLSGDPDPPPGRGSQARARAGEWPGPREPRREEPKGRQEASGPHS